MREQMHMVVMPTPYGTVLMTRADDSKEPAVYVEAGAAELRCAALRARFGDAGTFTVLDFYPA